MKSAGERQQTFGDLLREYTSDFGDHSLSRPDVSLLREKGVFEAVSDVYNQLGGIWDDIPCRPGRYDFVLLDKLVELDEEAHFNRYRAQTLQSDIYQDYLGFSSDNYIDLCQNQEATCLMKRSGGGFWTNSSCEKYFGPAASNRDLAGNGSPRWKQRAFYDFIKDLSPLTDGPLLVRISVYDELVTDDGQKVTVNDILLKRDLENFRFVWDRIAACQK